MNPDFVRLAHRKAVWAELRRVILDRYIAEDAPAKEQIICEEVPYKNKDVTPEAILECLREIELLETQDHYELNQYELKKRTTNATPRPSDGAVEKTVDNSKPRAGKSRAGGHSEQKDAKSSREAEEPRGSAEPHVETPAPKGKRGRAKPSSTG